MLSWKNAKRKLISIKDTPSGKICVIETGEGKNTSYMAVDVFAIYNIETPVSEKKTAEKADETAGNLVVDNKAEQVEQEQSADATIVDAEKTEAEEQPAQKKSRKKAEPKGELDKIKAEENK